MEKLSFKLPKPQSRYDLIKEISDLLNEPVKKWLGRLKDIEPVDILKTYQSAQALSRDRKMEFGKSWNYHIREILKR